MYEVDLIDRNGEKTSLQKGDVIVVSNESVYRTGCRVRVVRIDSNKPKAQPFLRWQETGYPNRDPMDYVHWDSVTARDLDGIPFYFLIVQVMAAFFGHKINMMSMGSEYDRCRSLVGESVILMARVED